MICYTMFVLVEPRPSKRKPYAILCSFWWSQGPQNTNPMLCYVRFGGAKGLKTQTLCYAMFVLVESRASKRKPYAMLCYVRFAAGKALKTQALCYAMFVLLQSRASKCKPYAMLCYAMFVDFHFAMCLKHAVADAPDPTQHKLNMNTKKNHPELRRPLKA